MIDGFEALAAARARGALADELRSIDQACQAHVRNYVGDEVYGEIVHARVEAERRIVLRDSSPWPHA